MIYMYMYTHPHTQWNTAKLQREDNTRGTGEDCVKWNRLEAERQTSNDFTHMWNKENKTEKQTNLKKKKS